jgi:hypothetical protein
MRRRTNLLQFDRKSECLAKKKKKNKALKTRKASYDFVGEKKKEKEHFLSNEKSSIHFVV